jgi:hypothetical protein
LAAAERFHHDEEINTMSGSDAAVGTAARAWGGEYAALTRTLPFRAMFAGYPSPTDPKFWDMNTWTRSTLS